MSSLEIAKKVLRTEAAAVAALIDKLDEGFGKAVDIIYDCRGRVVVTGMGKSGLIGKKIAATLASTGTPAFFMHPAEASHGDLGMVTSDDVIFGISNSGETEEILQLVPFIKRFGVKFISMTGNPESTMSKSADINLDVSINCEACPMGIVPTASTTAAAAMGDAVAVALLTKRGFREEDFAAFHPGGSLGKRLFIKVMDLMHAGDDLPVVQPEETIAQAVIVISSKRLGLGVVHDKDGKIAGVITDGDIRRGLQKWGKDFFDMRVKDAVTKGPKLIGEDELAAKALAVMQQYSITSLVVPDESGRAKGIIHLHDILRKGIA
ncbi:MAG: KpsF/GutQ family sugar-phosphate isomerase [Dissulfurispiraceae bacterium]|jgi:arabinose-5-phosphate isomerase|nr:KpsF/GutQ family sugar-phosphate isomerase [Dissulfurispiraceae bacterium]